MSALAKLQTMAATDVARTIPAPQPRIMARVIPFVAPVQQKQKKFQWWIPLGLAAFSLGLGVAIWAMDDSPNFLRTSVFENNSFITMSDPEAADSYAETIYPPPSDVVVPVPVIPSLSNLRGDSGEDDGAEISAGIALAAPGRVPDLSETKIGPVVTVVDKTRSPEEARVAVQSTNSPADTLVLDQAQARLDEGDETGAIALYDRVLKRNANNHAALAGKAFALQLSGKYEQAAATGRHLVKLNPTDEDANINFVTALGSWGSLSAVNELKRISGKKPDFAAAQAALALALARQGNALEALPHARSAIEAEPDNMYYQLDLAIVYDQLGHTAEAVELYGKVLAAYDNTDEAPQALPESVSSVRERHDYLQGMLDSAKKMAGG